MIANSKIIDLLDESRYQPLLANPAWLGLELRTLPAHQVVVLDEVQRVPTVVSLRTISLAGPRVGRRQ